MTAPNDRACLLVTNDDGIDAAGLAALVSAVAHLGRVVVVAPDRERSGAGHALTLGRPLRVRSRGEDRFEVDGTPTDCVHLGVFNLTGGRPPQLVLSGINRGANLGDDVLYSGTVAAAIEGRFLGLPAIAVSLVLSDGGHYETAARVAAELVMRIQRTPLDRATI